MTLGFLLGSTIEANMDVSAFKSFERGAYIESAVQLVAADGAHELLDHDFASRFCASLEQLGPLCQSVAEVGYLAIMRNTASSLLSDVFESKLQRGKDSHAHSLLMSAKVTFSIRFYTKSWCIFP